MSPAAFRNPIRRWLSLTGLAALALCLRAGADDSGATAFGPGQEMKLTPAQIPGALEAHRDPMREVRETAERWARWDLRLAGRELSLFRSVQSPAFKSAAPDFAALAKRVLQEMKTDPAAAATSLKALAVPDACSQCDVVLTVVREGHGSLRFNALQALQNMEDPGWDKARDELAANPDFGFSLDILSYHQIPFTDEQKLRAALVILSQSPKEVAKAPPWPLEAAVELAVRKGGGAAWPLLEQCLSSPFRELREAVILSMPPDAKWGRPDQLVGFLDRSSSWKVTSAAIRQLGNKGAVEMANLLAPFLDTDFKGQAVRSLAQLKARQFAPKVGVLLRDENQDALHRAVAAVALYRMGRMDSGELRNWYFRLTGETEARRIRRRIAGNGDRHRNFFLPSTWEIQADILKEFFHSDLPFALTDILRAVQRWTPESHEGWAAFAELTAGNPHAMNVREIADLLVINDRDVRLGAHRALGHFSRHDALGRVSGEDVLKTQELAEDIWQCVLAPQDADIRAAALFTSIHLSPEKFPQAIYELLNQEEDAGFRAHLLGQIRYDWKSAETALRFITEEESEDVVSASFGALPDDYSYPDSHAARLAALMKPGASRQFLLDTFKQAGRCEGFVKYASAVAKTLEWYYDAEFEIEVMRLLGALKAVKYAPLVTAKLRQFRHWPEVLKRSNALRGLPKLSGSLEIRSDSAAAGLLEILLQMGSNLPEKELISLLTSSSRSLRHEALKALAQAGSDSIMPYCMKFLAGGNDEDQGSALNAISVYVQHGGVAPAEVIDAVAALANTDDRALARLGELRCRRHLPLVLGELKNRYRTPEALEALRQIMGADFKPLVHFPLAANLSEDVKSKLLQETLSHTGTQLDEDGAFLLESAATSFQSRGQLLCLAHLLFHDRTEVAPAVLWLGGRAWSERPPIPRDRVQAGAVMTSIRRVAQFAAENELLKTHSEGLRVAAEIAQQVPWEQDDMPMLKALAAEIEREASVGHLRPGMQTLISDLEYRHPARRALRAVTLVVILQPLLWVVVMLIYPWWRPAQRMVWNRGIRRWLGWGWVGAVIVRTGWLRNWLWRPFREELVPPEEAVGFDEWTFFDGVEITAADGDRRFPALSTLRDWSGITVLSGASGLGKTTLLHALAATAEKPVAFLRAVECPAGPAAALAARLPLRVDRNFLSALLRRGSPALLVDAVHEAAEAAQRTITNSLLPGMRVLLSTQPASWRPPEGAALWHLLPLRPQDLRDFLLQQGSAAVEAGGAASLAERQQRFTANVEAFLKHVASLPPDTAEAAALRAMLGNPMEAVLCAELLAAGQFPDPHRLMDQRLEQVVKDYTVETGDAFPSGALAASLERARREGAALLLLEGLEEAAEFLARHRLLRAAKDGGWRFRHDKIKDWFAREAVVPA